MRTLSQLEAASAKEAGMAKDSAATSAGPRAFLIWIPLRSRRSSRRRADAAIVLSRHDTVNYGKRGRVIPTLRALLDASHTLRYPAPMPITEDILREMRVRR